MNKMPAWIILILIFTAIAAICIFVLKGYSFLGYTLLLVNVLLLLHHLTPEGVWKTVDILVAFGLLYFCCVEIPIVSESKTDKDCSKPYIIVLGAEVVGSSPSRSLRYRINAALEYLHQYPDSIAIVSGGQGEHEDITEAECMYRELVAVGISPERILKEEAATSTMENLRYSFDIIRARGDSPDGNTAILSSSYHLCRAKLMAKKLGVHTVGVACYPGNPFLALNFFIREAFGLTQLMIFGR